MKKWPNKYDISKLGTVPDADLAKYWNISRERIRQFRKQLNIPSFNHKNDKLEKIVYYVKNFDTSKVFTLTDLYRKLGTSYKPFISRKLINDIAIKHNVKLRFFETDNHGYAKYSREKCRCDICRLSNNIRSHFKCKYHHKLYDFYANEYVYLYKLDKTRLHLFFYKFLDEDVKLKNDEKC